MKLHTLIIGLAIIVILGAAGLFLWRQANPSRDLDGIGSETNSAAGNDFALREVTKTFHKDVAGAGGCDVNLLYPQIDSSALGSDARDRMNGDIQNMVKQFLTTSDASIDDAATEWTESCAADMTDVQSWVSEVGYDVKQNTNGILSIALSNYLNQGGAHPNITQLFLTFDVTTGMQLSLRDILDPAQIESFEVKEKQWLIDHSADQLFEESLNEFKAYLAAPSIDETNRYIDDALFYTTPTAIGIVYNSYAIAPYVAGSIVVELTREELGTIVVK